MERDVRIPLEKGTQITINGSVFTIDDVIGRGGLSLVYSAMKEGGTTESVIKEFYPAPDSRGRIYADRDEYGHVHCVDDLFEKQYKDMLYLFEAEGPIGGDSAKISFQILPFWEYHDGYAVMKKESADMRSLKTLVYEWEQNAPLPPSGKPRENDPIFNNMVRLNYALNIVDSLLSALGAVHEKYIHLDLSSSNVIWACREQTGRTGCAVITDFGSAAVLDECGEFRPNYKLFCSLGFAAPEVFDLQPVFTRRTDLYSVGMLLIYLCIGEKRFMNRFSRIKRPGRLGRDIASIDLQLLKNTGAKLNAFLQTALVERKYDTAQEMQAGLRELLVSTQGYLTDRESAVIPIGDKIQGGIDDKHYIERKEIKDIEVLLNSNQIPFVTGIGGIGKTTLVRRFAKEYADKYFVSFVTYAGSFRNTITALGARNCDENEWVKMAPDERFSAGLAFLKSFSSNHVLIIDNADTGAIDLRSDPDFHHFREMPLNIIITTRNDMEGDEVIHLKEMNEDDCMKLMKSYLTEYRDGKCDETLKAIISQINGHTLTCDLLARMLSESIRLRPEGVLAALKESKVDGENWREVQSYYNLDNVPRTVLAHLQTVFVLSELSVEVRNILGCFCLAKHGLTKEYIGYLFSDEEFENILEAEKRGWLMCREESIERDFYPPGIFDIPIRKRETKIIYILHPIIYAVCMLDKTVRPTWVFNKSFVMKYSAIFFNIYGNKIDWYWETNGADFIDYYNGCFKSYGVYANIAAIPDFDVLEREEPSCAGIIYIKLMEIIYELPEYLDDMLKTLFSKYRNNYWTDDFDFLKPRDQKIVYYKQKELFGFYSEKALTCVKTDMLVYSLLLSVLAGRCHSYIGNVEISRAMRYWYINVDCKMDNYIKNYLWKEWEEWGEGEYFETYKDFIQVCRLLMSPKKELRNIANTYYDELTKIRVFLGDKGEEYCSSVEKYSFMLYDVHKNDEAYDQLISGINYFANDYEIESFLSAAENYWFALFQLQKYEDALKLLENSIRLIEHMPVISHWAYEATKTSDEVAMGKLISEFRAWVRGATWEVDTHLQKYVSYLSNFCELQYWLSKEGGTEELAESYKNKYIYYISLMKYYECSQAWSRESGSRYILYKCYADYPFFLPVLDKTLYYDRDVFFPPFYKKLKKEMQQK